MAFFCPHSGTRSRPAKLVFVAAHRDIIGLLKRRTCTIDAQESPDDGK